MNLQEYLKHPHDHFCKELLTPTENASAFMESFLPSDVLDVLDVSQPLLDNDSFVDEALRDQHSDLLYRVKRKTGAAVYV
jgi:predicted transposase/invertase (TIGR01784 family)